MLKVIDDQWMSGEFLNFKDEGRAGKATNTYSVLARKNGALLGQVKWFSQWVRYAFFPINGIFDAKCLREISEFLDLKTAELRKTWDVRGPQKVRKFGVRKSETA
jgi:hypothetical protein